MASRVKEQRKGTRKGSNEREQTDSSNSSAPTSWKNDVLDNIKHPKLRSLSLRALGAGDDVSEASASSSVVEAVDGKDKARALAALAVAARVQHRVALKEAQSGSSRHARTGQHAEELFAEDKDPFSHGNEANLLNFDGLDGDDLSCDTTSSEMRARAALVMAAKLKEKRKLMRKAKKASKISNRQLEEQHSYANDVTLYASSVAPAADDRIVGGRSDEDKKESGRANASFPTKIKAKQDANQLLTEAKLGDTRHSKVSAKKEKKLKKSLSVSGMNLALAETNLKRTPSPTKTAKNKTKALKKSSSTSDLSSLFLSNESEFLPTNDLCF